MSDSTFARNQLLKHGWTEGSGLGREESGMKEAIKVQIKNNKTGVGHDPGAEFTHHWWDHVFNKTAKSITVGADQNGEVTLSKKSPDSKEEKKARKRMVLYGNFVKGATLKQEEGRHVEEKEGSSSSSESEEEETRYKPSEEEVFQRCGGRTAHKGARHGLKLNGKLQRVQAMEAQQMLQMTATPQQPDGGTPDLHGLDAVPVERNKRKHTEQEMESPVENSMAHESVKKKKKKKKARHVDEEVESPVQENFTGSEGVKKKKKRKKERHTEEEVESPVQESSRLNQCDGKVGALVETGPAGYSEDSQCDTQCLSEGKKKRKKCKKIKESEEGEELACESHHSKKKKKKKKSREND